MAPSIRVTMLGKFTIAEGGNAPVREISLTGRSRRLWTLTAYLIIHRDRGVSAQELIDLLDSAASSPVGGGGAPVAGEGKKVDELPIQGGGGYGALQRAVTQEGVNR